MILVQKQPNLPMALPLPPKFNYHRRLPSAPVVVQPTRTPGLLTLSKPIQNHRSPPPRQQIQQSKAQRSPPKTKPQTPATTGPRAPQPEVPKPAPPATENKKPAAAAAPPSSTDRTFNPRGRQQAKPPKDKGSRRSASHSGTHGRRNNARQPSPPLPSLQQQLQQPSQAEAPHTPPRPSHVSSRSQSFVPTATSNLFDPFLVDSDTSLSSPALSNVMPTTNSVKSATRATPTLTPRPTGKLAARRQHTPPPQPSTPTPSVKSRAVPVPRTPRRTATHDPRHQLSRSEPPRRSATVEWGAFPVCDDNDDDGDRVDEAGPKTAPLSSSFTMGARGSGFPFTRTPSPSPASNLSRQGRRVHQRTPSEGMFAMDSDSSSSGQRTPVREKFGVGAGYFASSMFQNSPSPDELPPPSF